MDDYCLISELARMAGLAENTARRYVKNFPERFPGKVYRRKIRYPLAAVDTLRRIADLRGQGLRTEEVRRRLEEQEPETGERHAGRKTAGTAARDASPEPAGLRAEIELLKIGLAEASGLSGRLAGEQAVLRQETGRLAMDLAEERAKAGHLKGELASARDALEHMARDLGRIREENRRLAARLSEMLRERQELEERLDARLAALEALQGPSPDFMRLPIVFRSEQGEFLGVSDKQTGQHFSLRDFVYLIHKNAGGRKDVDTVWQRLGGAGWRLVIHESAPLSGRRKSHHVDVERFTTPIGNLVARLVDLCFDGQTMPPFLVYELFRQIGRDFS